MLGKRRVEKERRNVAVGEGRRLNDATSLLAMAGGGLLGTILAVMRIAGSRPIAAIAAGYVNGLRSVPLIMVIFWFYLLVPLVIGRPIGAFTSALVAFVIFKIVVGQRMESTPEDQAAALS